MKGIEKFKTVLKDADLLSIKVRASEFRRE
jgi:hypothetical protein